MFFRQDENNENMRCIEPNNNFQITLRTTSRY